MGNSKDYQVTADLPRQIVFSLSIAAMSDSRKLSRMLFLVLLVPFGIAPAASAAAEDQFGCPVLAPPSPQPAVATTIFNRALPSKTVFKTPPTPVVSVKLRIPADVNVNQEVECKIIVEALDFTPSRGSARPATSGRPSLRASPEPSAKDPELIWKLGTLSAGCKQEISLVLLPTTAGAIANCARVEFEHGQCTTTRVHKPGLQVRREGPKRWTIQSTNGENPRWSHQPSQEFRLASRMNRSRRSSLGDGDLAPSDSETTEYGEAVNAGKACPSGAPRRWRSQDEFESCVQVNGPKMNLVNRGR